MDMFLPNSRLLLLAFVISCLTFLSPPSSAEPEYPDKVTVFFGNGIFTDEWGATNNLIALRNAIAPEIRETDLEDNIIFRKAYNRSEGPFGLFDLLEAASQYLEINISRVYSYFSGAEPSPENLSLFLIQYAAQEMSRISLLDLNPSVQNHVEIYNKTLQTCHRIVLVAHSQGNFYGNIAYTGIDGSLIDAFKIVSLANPASFVAGDGVHTTLNEDSLITSIPNSMDSNFENYGPDEIPLPIWGLGHLFEQNYLAEGRGARRKIVNDVISTMREVQSFDINNYCGWPAVYANYVSLWRRPPDREINESGAISSESWEVLWEAVRNNSLIVEFRLGTGGGWTPLTLRGLSDRSAYYRRGSSDTLDEKAPFIWFNNLSLTEWRTKSVEVQPYDVAIGAPYGIQQYRFVVDNKVVAHFSIDYDRAYWNPARTSRPIAEELEEGSNNIVPIY